MFKVLNVAQRYDLMDVVLFYIKYALVPYYQESLTPACKKVTRAENLTLVGLSFGSHSQSVQLASLWFQISQKIYKMFKIYMEMIKLIINIYYNAYIFF